MKGEPLYEGIPMRAHVYVMENDWNDDELESWFPRTWRLLQRYGSLENAVPDECAHMWSIPNIRGERECLWCKAREQ